MLRETRDVGASDQYPVKTRNAYGLACSSRCFVLDVGHTRRARVLKLKQFANVLPKV